MGIGLDWCTIQQPQGSHAESPMNEACKTMVEGTYQPPPLMVPSLNCLTQTFDGHHGLNLLKMYPL